MIESSWVSGALTILFDAALKTALVIAVVRVWTLLFPSVSAAVRHMVWTAALVASTVLLIVVPFAPAWRVALPLPDRPDLVRTADAAPSAGTPSAVVNRRAIVMTEESAVEAAPDRATVVVAAVPSSPVPAAPGAAVLAPSPVRAAAELPPASFPSGQSELPLVLFLAWFVGMTAVATPLLRATARLRRLERAAPPIRSARIRLAFDAEAAALGIGSGIPLLAGGRGSMPMTWGVRRPVVLLPANARTWSTARLHTVLSHELAHVARRDALTHLAGEIACTVQWFNPLVWLAARRQREEREHACDDRVLTAGAAPADYASELVSLARSLRPARAAAISGMAMARGRSLRGRLVAVLDEDRDRRPVTAVHVARATLLGALVVMPLACLAPARAGSATEEPAARGVPAAIESIETPASPATAVSVEARPEPAMIAAPDPHSRPPEPDVRAVAVPPAPVADPAFAQPDPDLTVRVLRQAALRGLGDREMADLLETALETGAIDRESTRAAYLAAARTIGSDSHMARALDGFVSTSPDAAALRAAVEVSAGIGSDRELSRLLVKIVAIRPVDGALRETLVDAAAGIRSERDRRAVLEALSRSGGSI